MKCSSPITGDNSNQGENISSPMEAATAAAAAALAARAQTTSLFLAAMTNSAAAAAAAAAAENNSAGGTELAKAMAKDQVLHHAAQCTQREIRADKKHQAKRKRERDIKVYGKR